MHDCFWSNGTAYRGHVCALSMFKKTIENFTCERCSVSVRGDGYTNHCPKCLWSKHVDVEPGDRAAACGGMMKPIRVEGPTGKYRIIHECEACGIIRPIAIGKDDDMQTILGLAGNR